MLENNTKPRYDLLLKTCDKLETLPKKKFDFSHWVDRSKWKGRQDLSCGTSACAAGWATTIPAVRKTGLRLHNKLGFPMILNSWEEDDTALARAFRLQRADVWFLFYPSKKHGQFLWESPPDTANAKQVAAHIRRWVNAHKVLHEDLVPREPGI